MRPSVPYSVPSLHFFDRESLSVSQPETPYLNFLGILWYEIRQLRRYIKSRRRVGDPVMATTDSQIPRQESLDISGILQSRSAS